MIDSTPARTCSLMVISGLILALTACGGGSDSGSLADVPLYTDILTLETAIEDDPALDAFQIVDPGRYRYRIDPRLYTLREELN